MKKLKLLFSLSIFTLVSISAQPILNKNNIVFSYPDSVSYFVADSNSVIDTVVGADKIFDYSNLKGYGSIQKVYYLNPSTTPGAINFTTANLAEKSDASASNCVYTINSDDSITNLGFVANVIDFGLTTAKYNVDPEKIMKFPFVYGNTFVDAYAGTFSVNHAIAGLVSTNAIGSVTITADGWGQLNLPNALKLDSVLRVKRVETMVTNPIVLTPLPSIPPITVNATIINYYKPSLSKAPLLSIVEGAYAQSGSIIQSNKTIVSQYPIGFVSVEEINSLNSVNIYPNPSSTYSTLVLVAEKESNVKIEILNALGQHVLNSISSNLMIGSNMFKMDTDKLLSGIYFIVITINDKPTSIRKLIVE